MGYIIIDEFKIEGNPYLSFSLTKNISWFVKIINFFRQSEEYIAKFKFEIDIEKKTIFVSAGALKEFTENEIRDLVYRQLLISHKAAKL